MSQTRGAQPAKLRDITDAVGFLRMERAIQASQNDFDNKPNLLNGPNGYYDLEKGLLAAWEPLHGLSRQMPTPYVPGRRVRTGKSKWS